MGPSSQPHMGVQIAQGDIDDHRPLLHDAISSAQALCVVSTPPLAGVGKPERWNVRQWIKILVSALLGLLLLTVLVAGVIDGSAGKGGGRHGYHSISDEGVKDIASSLPTGAKLNVPRGAGRPIVKEVKNATHNETGVLVAPDPHINYTTLLKPAYHLAPDVGGWMNDPNGMFQMPGGGPLHVFFQWNPHQPIWGSPWWGHVVSWDLAHWRLLPPALMPDMWYDKDGVFSGSATILPNGKPVMLYTGVMNFSQYGFYYQVQAAAMPVNMSDPLLVEWRKTHTPLDMEIPPGGTHAQFRDPMTAWRVEDHQVEGVFTLIADEGHVPLPDPKRSVITGTSTQAQGGNGTGIVQWREFLEDENGIWMTAIATLDNCIGAAALYASNDSLRTWFYVGTLTSQLSFNFTRYSTCMPPEKDRDGKSHGTVPPGSRGYGGHCDQFGSDCRMWECPDFFDAAPGVQAFKYSDQEVGRTPFAGDYYVLGDAGKTNYTHAHLQDGLDAYKPVLADQLYIPRLLDYGSVYASKSFQMPEPDGRRLWLGWVYEDSRGCSEICGDGTSFILEHQAFQGAQTLLRELVYDETTQTLVARPIPELQTLRKEPALVLTSAELHTHGSSTGTPSSQMATFVLLPERPPGPLPTQGADTSMPNSPSGGRQLEVQLNFSLPALQQDAGSPDDTTFLVGLRLNTGNSTYTDIFMNGTLLRGTLERSDTGISPQLEQLWVWVDRNQGGGMTPSPAPLQGGPVPVPSTPGAAPANNLTLSVYVDRSVIEVYAMGGRSVITSRVYALPLPVDGVDGEVDRLGSWGAEVLAAWGEGRKVQVQASVYELGSCWVS